MYFSISGIGAIPQSQIHEQKEIGAPKTVFTLENAHSMEEYERSNIRRRASSPLLQLDSLSREGYKTHYTAENALTNLWRCEHNRFNLNDQSTWQNISISLTPTQEELDILHKELETNGLGGAVDWVELSGEVQSFRELKSKNLADGMDYFASRYVAIRDKLERNFSEDELVTQLKKLDATYQQGSSYFVDGYAKKLQSSLGLTAEQEQTVRESLQVNFNQKIESYQLALKQVEFSKNPKDAWLQNHDAYMAAQLRETAVATSAKSAGVELYTMDDLVAAGKIGEEYQCAADNASHGQNEVCMALDMGMLDMKTEALMQTGKLSGSMAKLLKSTQNNRQQAVIAAADERLASFRKINQAKGESASSFAPIDHDMIQTIYQKVMDTFRGSGGNAVKAIYRGVETAKSVTTVAHGHSPEVSRWGISMESWLKDFNTPREAMGIEKVANEMFGIQDKRNSHLQDLSDSWQHFMSTLNGSGDSWYLGAEGAGVPAYASVANVIKEFA